MSDGHYTAVVEVTHTMHEKVERPAGARSATSLDQVTPRKKRDITRIVMRADSMDKLQERLTAHIALIVDDEGMTSDAR